ncbi:MAG TPA: LysE family translocator [Solirubrobacteraceae bacterium]|nr:LysE family translocator [Solirubrobacteraceae bacterium]
MISSGHLLGYAVASFVLIVIPGPSVVFVIGRALAYGRRTALSTVCGNAAGNYVVAVCVAVGIGAVVQRSAAVFTALKLAGAVYLIWLGVAAIRRRKGLATAFGAAAAAPRGRSAAREGFVVGVTNPKALILFGAVLPQFVDRTGGHVQIQMLVLALVSIAIGLCSDSMWAVTASAVRKWFARSPRRLELVGGAGGLAMIGVGLTIALTGRRS